MSQEHDEEDQDGLPADTEQVEDAAGADAGDEAGDAAAVEPSTAAEILASTGRGTGLVVLLGTDCVECVPVYEQQTLERAIIRLGVSEAAVLDFLIKQLAGRGEVLSGHEDARHLLNEVGYVSTDYYHDRVRTESSPELEKTCTLSDGRTVTLSAERFTALESYFRPSLVGIDEEGVHKTAFHAISKTDVSLRPQLYQNIVLVGTAASYPGFVERFRMEFETVGNPQWPVRVIAL